MNILRALAVSFALAATTACATGESLYRPGPSVLRAGPVGDFDQYVESVRAHVNANLVAVAGFSRQQQVAWNLPFRTTPAGPCSNGGRLGLLMVHGLSDSPFVFRDLAAYLAERCVEVRTLLLQGHGTRPGDMVTASAEVWRDQVRHHFEALSQAVDTAFIGGFSLGGALATDYALARSGPRPAGLIAVAPAWKLNGLSDYLWLAPVADVFGDFVEREPERNPVKYESVTFNAGSQIADVISVTQDRMTKHQALNLPLFLAATEADSVINLDYLVSQFHHRFVNPRNRMLIFRDTRQAMPLAKADQRIQSLNSFLPDANILEFSHQSLLIAPGNTLYGVGAPLQRCLEPNNISLEGCLQLPDSELWFSAWHDTPRPVYTSRLTYNPWFGELANAIWQFIRANVRAAES